MRRCAYLLAAVILAVAPRQAGAQLEAPLNVSTNSSHSLAPDVAVDGSNVYVVWYDQEGSGVAEVLFKRSVDEGRTFGDAVDLSESPEGGSALLPRVAAAGPAVYVVWEDDTGSSPFVREIYFRRSLDLGQTWEPPLGTPPTNLSSTPATESVAPAIAVAGPEVYVAWQESTATRQVIRFSRSTDGGKTFVAATMPLSDTSFDCSSPSLAAAGSNVYAAWVERRAGSATMPHESFDIVFSRSTDEGQSFEAGGNLSNNDGASLSPTVAAAGAGVYVGWQDDSGRAAETPEILFRVSSDQGISFSSSLGAADLFNASFTPSRASRLPRVAAAGSSFSIAWQEALPGNSEVFARSYSLLGQEGTVPLVEDPLAARVNVSESAPASRHAGIAMAGSNLYVVWEEGEPLSSGEIFLRKTAPLPGEAVGNLSANRSRPAILPSVAVDGRDVYAAWSQFPDAATGLEVFFRRSVDGGREFSPRKNLSEVFGDSSQPSVAAAGQAVYVAWRDETDPPGTHDIFFRRSLDRGTTWLPPLGSPAENLSAVLGDGSPSKDSRAPALAAVGSEIYLVWEDETTDDESPQVHFRRSLDQGANWDPPVRITPISDVPKAYQAFSPGVAAAGSNVYVIWKQFTAVKLEIHLNFSVKQQAVPIFGQTASSGFVNLTEGLPTVFGDPSSSTLSDPAVVAVGPVVHVVWHQEGEIRFRTSTIEGASVPVDTTWTPAIGAPATSLSGSAGGSRAPAIAAVGTEVYVAWQSETAADPPEIVFRRSRNLGLSFTERGNLSSNSGRSFDPTLAAAGADVYLAWSDDTNMPHFSDILLLASNDEAASFVGCTTIDLSIGATDGVATAAPGASLGYRIVVRNDGCDLVTRAKITGTIPPGLSDVRWCRGEGCRPSRAGELDDTFDLPAGSEVVYVLHGVVSPTFSGTLSFTATVEPPESLGDDDPSDNSSTDLTEVLLAPGVTAFCAAIEGVFLEGETVTYTFVLLNGGPATQADNPGAEFTDTLPAGLTLVGATADSGTVATILDTVTWNGAIPAGGSVTISIAAVIGPDTAGTTLCNQGTIAFDADGDGVNESTGTTDDPTLRGDDDPCCFRVLRPAEVPALSAGVLAMLALVLALLGLSSIWRRFRG